MRFAPATAVPVVFVVVLAVTGCSGDDTPDEPDPSTPESSAGTTEGGELKELPRRTCETSVTVTGASAAAWTGPGSSRGSGPKAAVYTSENGQDRLTVYSGGGGAEPAVNVTVGGEAYGTRAGSVTDLGADTNGKRAAIGLAVPALQGDGEVNVVADFTCK